MTFRKFGKIGKVNHKVKKRCSGCKKYFIVSNVNRYYCNDCQPWKKIGSG